MVAAAGARLAVRLEQVDGNGLLPLRASDGAFATAMAFRRHFQRVAGPHLVPSAFPSAAPLDKLPRVLRDAGVPAAIARRWPAAPAALLAADPAALAALSIDHGVPPVATPGGARAAQLRATAFVDERLSRYGERNHPDTDSASGLSAYLHFGHVGAHEVVRRVLDAADWDPSRLGPRATGRREGWWGAPPEIESFLDELITWRELGYGFCFHRPDYDRYGSLPAWARATLAKHAADPRPVTYTPAELAGAMTYDRIWNAAQRELLVDGRIHNYLRMLWGKRILEWSPSPRAALTTLIALNNRYAVDGRDPNSYSGIFWTLGRFDRPWGPERPIFGTVRYMSSDATRRKLDLDRYLERFGDPARSSASTARLSTRLG
jgi:deoxyribodipyrimidine photo-lyase